MDSSEVRLPAEVNEPFRASIRAAIEKFGAPLVAHIIVDVIETNPDLSREVGNILARAALQLAGGCPCADCVAARSLKAVAH